MNFRHILKQVPLSRKVGHFINVHFINGNEDTQWARIIMNRETQRLLHSLDIEHYSALEISGSAWHRFGFQKYRSIEYPEYDVCGDVLNEHFDIIIMEQVLEHLLWPYRAIRNIFNMLNANGVLLVTTPFLIKIHKVPEDCSRWTEVGIRHLLAEGGFDIGQITTGSWGNRACIRSNWRRWTPYQPWLHSLKNEPDYPVVVWAVARK